MKILVELTDATSSTAKEFKTLLEEELAGVLGKRGFSVKVLQIESQKELAMPAERRPV